VCDAKVLVQPAIVRGHTRFENATTVSRRCPSIGRRRSPSRRCIGVFLGVLGGVFFLFGFFFWGVFLAWVRFWVFLLCLLLHWGRLFFFFMGGFGGGSLHPFFFSWLFFLLFFFFFGWVWGALWGVVGGGFGGCWWGVSLGGLGWGVFCWVGGGGGVLRRA